MDDVDRGQPWQTQYAERLSRSIDQGSTRARRQLKLFFLCLALLFIAVVVAFFATAAWRSAFG